MIYEDRQHSSSPFQDHWWEHEGTCLHFFDEGAGPVVLCLHGNPTWAFLYRRVIEGLRGEHRVIAIDYPGFGLSDYPEGYPFTPEAHAAWVAAFVRERGLERYWLVAHDWGGPIGLSQAVRDPDAIAGIVLINTWCGRVPVKARLFSWILGNPIGRYAILKHNLLARWLLPWGVYRRLTSEVRHAYAGIGDSAGFRYGSYRLVRALCESGPWMRSIRDGLARLSDTPVTLVWGKRDPVLGGERMIERWLEVFPRARVVRVPDASHFVPEDRPDCVVEALRRMRDRSLRQSPF